MRLLWFLTCFWVLLPRESQGQRTLSLENAHRFKRYRFIEGDDFRFRTLDTRAWNSGTLGEIRDSSIVLVRKLSFVDEGKERTRVIRDEVRLEHIEWVYYGNQTSWDRFRRSYGGTAFIGGLALMAIAGVNAWTMDEPAESTSLQIAGGIALAGLIVRFSGKSKYRIGGRWTLRSMAPQAPLPQPIR